MTAISTSGSGWNPAQLVENFARTMKHLLPSCEGAWVEISPYGFISKNYFSYVAGMLGKSGCTHSVLSDGTSVISFPDGSFIIQGSAGHIVELDKRRRVVLVRVRKSEAEGARLALRRDDLNECYKVAIKKDGSSVMVMPGNIQIAEDASKITVTLPNGTEVFARKQV